MSARKINEAARSILAKLELQGWVQSRIWRFACGRIDTDSLRDLAQEAFLRVCEQPPVVFNEPVLRAWLDSAARNIVHEWLRSPSIRRPIDIVGVKSDQLEFATCENLGEDDDLVIGEKLELVMLYADQLPRQLKRAFRFSREGLDSGRIAERMGVKESTVRKYLADAERRIRASAITAMADA